MATIPEGKNLANASPVATAAAPVTTASCEKVPTKTLTHEEAHALSLLRQNKNSKSRMD
jgi:hypothetical protein